MERCKQEGSNEKGRRKQGVEGRKMQLEGPTEARRREGLAVVKASEGKRRVHALPCLEAQHMGMGEGDGGQLKKWKGSSGPRVFHTKSLRWCG